MIAIERKEREREFHDAAFAEGRRRKLRPLYGIAAPARALYDRLLEEQAPGSRVLEFGCGQGSSALRLAGRGCDVVAIDISQVAVDDARRGALAAGASRARFERMDAEKLAFVEGSFDLVCGTGILHHLDLAAAVREMDRVLGPQGRAVFLEPLGHNPLVNAFRRLTPKLRTPDEHPLMLADLAMLRRAFPGTRVTYVALLALFAAPLVWLPGAARLLGALHAADAWLFRRWPSLRRHAWTCVIEMRKAAS
jgi:SAM-dependent methyltransferase